MQTSSVSRRDPVFSVVKALAIMLVVVSHAGSPAWLSRFAFEFHVPAFFICAGYFFRAATPQEEYRFLCRRVSGVYRPYVCWSLVFLCLHNLLYPLGLLSERFGNAVGGVMHPYDWTAFCRRLWSIVFNMSGHDEFLAGSFWFFRAFFIAGILWLVLFKALRMVRTLAEPHKAACGVAFVALGLALWQVLGGIRIAGIAQGGYRELMGLFFMACGYVLAYCRPLERLTVPQRAAAALGCLAVVVLFTVFSPSAMVWRATPAQFFSLPLPALAGFGLLWLTADALCLRDSFVRRGLVYLGDRTLVVFAFHLVAFKLVSLFVVASYGLPWQQMGSHPVVHGLTGAAAGYLFIPYTLAGVLLPLGVRHLWRDYTAQQGLSTQRIVGAVLSFLVVVVMGVLRFLRALLRGFWRSLVETWQTLCEFVRAASPKDE